MKNYCYAIVSITVLLSSCLFDKGELLKPKTACIKKGTVIVNVLDPMSFSPATVDAMVGDTIKWVWGAGVLSHSTTSTSVPSGAATWNSGIQTGAFTYTYVLTKSGSYNYQCIVHGPSMSGTINVCE